MRQQPLVVEHEETAERRVEVVARGMRNVGRPQRTPDQQRRPLANHRGNGVDRERGAAALGDQCVRRVGEIAARVDERAVEIEDQERSVAGHRSAHDNGQEICGQPLYAASGGWYRAHTAPAGSLITL